MFTHNVHMFLDIQELRDFYKNERLDKTDYRNVVSVRKYLLIGFKDVKHTLR